MYECDDFLYAHFEIKDIQVRWFFAGCTSHRHLIHFLEYFSICFHKWENVLKLPALEAATKTFSINFAQGNTHLFFST